VFQRSRLQCNIVGQVKVGVGPFRDQVLRNLDRVITREKTDVFNFDIQRIVPSTRTRNGLFVSIAGIILFITKDKFDDVRTFFRLEGQIRQTIDSRCFL
jgi:L-2-hydroxyglutarate oxidase LhgO